MLTLAFSSGWSQTRAQDDRQQVKRTVTRHCSAAAAAAAAAGSDAIKLSTKHVVVYIIKNQLRQIWQVRLTDSNLNLSVVDCWLLLYVGIYYDILSVFALRWNVLIIIKQFSPPIIARRTRNSAVAERPRDASCHWMFRCYSRSLEVIRNDARV